MAGLPEIPSYNYKVKFKWVDREFLSAEELQRLVDLEINWPRIDMVREICLSSAVIPD